jgi:hypothetical protein
VEAKTFEPEAEFEVESAAAEEDLDGEVHLESIPEGTKENLHSSEDRAPRRKSSTLLRMEEKMQLIKAQMTLMLQHNQLLMECLFKGKEVLSPSILSKVTYMKNVPKPALWDTKDKQNIEFFMIEYKSYCDASGYQEVDVRMKSFSTFLKDSAEITFAAWRASQINEPAWATLKAWAIES